MPLIWFSLLPTGVFGYLPPVVHISPYTIEFSGCGMGRSLPSGNRCGGSAIRAVRTIKAHMVRNGYIHTLFVGDLITFVV